MSLDASRPAVAATPDGPAATSWFRALRPSALWARLRGAVGVVLLVALASRLAFLFWTDFAIESDEAVVGLMAKHIAEGRHFPVWYYGQEYMGALEAYVAALFVGVLGPTAAALKLTALVFALVFVGCATVLARRILGAAGGLIAGLYLAAPPLLLALWTLKLRGGFVSTLAIGHVILLLAHTLGTRGATLRGSFALGLFVGLGIWLNLLIVPFVAAAGLYLLSRRQVLLRPATLALCFLGFAVGAAPFWIYNVVHPGATFKVLLGGGKPQAWAHVKNTFERHLPMMLGEVAPWAKGGDHPFWACWLKSLFVASTLVFAWRERISLGRFLRASRGPTSGAELYALVAVGFLACAAFTRFGGDDEPRYALVLYAFLAPALGSTLAALWGRAGVSRAVALLLGAGVLAVGVGSIYRFDRRFPVQPLHYIWGNTVTPLDMSATHRALVSRGIEALSAEYWLGYRIAYETGERVATVPGRYPPFAERHRRARRRGHLALRPQDWAHWPGLKAQLDAVGVGAEEVHVDNLRLLLPKDTGHDARKWRATASSGDGPQRAFDGDEGSRWTANAGRDGWLSIDLGAEHPVGGVGGVFGGGLAGRLKIERSTDGATWSSAWEGDVAGARWHARFEARAARHVRLWAPATNVRPLSISELYVFAR